MLLLMLEKDMPIDAVLTADTGMEFPEMYEHLAKVDERLYKERGIRLTVLRHPKGFEWLMFDEPKQRPSSMEKRRKIGVPCYGNGWPGIRCRWCTGQLKTHLISKEINRLKGQYRALNYIGIRLRSTNTGNRANTAKQSTAVSGVGIPIIGRHGRPDRHAESPPEKERRRSVSDDEIYCIFIVQRHQLQNNCCVRNPQRNTRGGTK